MNHLENEKLFFFNFNCRFKINIYLYLFIYFNRDFCFLFSNSAIHFPIFGPCVVWFL